VGSGTALYRLGEARALKEKGLVASGGSQTSTSTPPVGSTAANVSAAVPPTAAVPPAPASVEPARADTPSPPSPSTAPRGQAVEPSAGPAEPGPEVRIGQVRQLSRPPLAEVHAPLS